MNQNKLTHVLVRGLHLFVIAALLAGLTMGVAPVAQAATFDIADGDVDGLIAAINTANGTSEADTINLAAGGTYTLTAVDTTPMAPMACRTSPARSPSTAMGPPSSAAVRVACPISASSTWPLEAT